MTELERCLPWIVRALDRSGNQDGLDKVLRNLATGHAQLWPANDGCLITELVQHVNRRGIRIWLAGGRLDQITDMTADVAAWARAQGCTFAEFDGRLGWERPLRKRGWKKRSVTMELDLEAIDGRQNDKF